MNRLSQVRSFIEYASKNNFLIEPQNRHEALKERLFDVINTYKPEVIVKAGLGHGDILLDIVKQFKTYTVVVEPSFQVIKDFINRNSSADLENIKFINGDFQDFPVDYYASDLLICIDYLNFFDSSKCINEFKRALKFEGIFFLGSVILNNNDMEGLYDEFMKMAFPLHNDYYLEEDITTLLGLKEFDLAKSIQLSFKNNLLSIIDFFHNIYNTVSKENLLEFINSHKTDFADLLKMNDNYDISESYYIGFHMRKKPEITG